MKLPCRHAMVYRKACGKPFIIPYVAIAPRWFGQSRLSQDELAEVAMPFVAKIYKTPTQAAGTTWSEAEKYRRVQQAFGRISSAIARFDDDQFQNAMTQLDQWWYNLRQGKTSLDQPSSSRQDDSDHDDGSSGGAAGGGVADAGTTRGPDRASDKSGNGHNDPSDGEPPTQVSGPSTRAAATNESSTQIPKIRLTGSIRRVGRPPINCVKQKAKAAVALQEYNNGMKLRALLRDNDVCDVVTTLGVIMPGMREVGSFLTTFQIKHKGEGRSIAWHADADYVPDRVHYRLPEAIIDGALSKLNGGLAKDEGIELDSDGERKGEIESYVVAIEKVGQFTREQLEAMKWLWNLQVVYRDGVLYCTWITRNVKPVVADPLPSSLLFGEILETWPYTSIRGFGFDLAFSDLFCFRDSAWLNDDAIRAFTVFLARYKNNGTVVIPPPKKDKAKQKKSAQKELLPANTLAEIASCVLSHPFVFVPVNFGGVHWACLVVDRDAKLVKIYDSMGGQRNRKRLRKMAREIRAGPLHDMACRDFEVTEPMQSDGDSCGVFVCRFFWTCVSSEAPRDVPPTGLTKLRWQMLHAITTVRRR